MFFLHWSANGKQAHMDLTNPDDPDPGAYSESNLQRSVLEAHILIQWAINALTQQK